MALAALRRLLIAGLLALAPALAVSATIPLELRFDGRAIDPAATPDFSCFSESRDQWVACRVTRGTAPGGWVLERPEPGRYRMHVSIDENAANPRRHPGDYEAQLRFEITPTGPDRIVVDLPQLIHLTRPGDNGRPIEGMLTGCATQPRFGTERYAWTPTAAVEFAWEPVAAGAEHRYVLSVFPCGPGGARREITSGRIRDTSVRLIVPPSDEGEHYAFRVEAWKDGRLVGDLYTHDGGTHSWSYRLRVRNASVPRWAYVAAGGALVLLLLGTWRLLGGDPLRRRRRLRWLAVGGLAAAAVVGAAAAVHRHRQDQERERVEAAQAATRAQQAARQREIVASFASAAPRPAWWTTVETPYRIDTLGDLLAAWQGHPRDPRGERRFFKAAYQGVLDHPEDDHLVATAVDLLHYVERDYPHRLGLATWGFERYFRHRQRTDNCANCMVGDTTQGLARNLAGLLADANRFDDALAALSRLIHERGADVSPYKLAEAWNQVAWIHWRRGDRDRALEVIREAITRYGHTVRRAELEQSLAHFERERG